MRLGLRNVASGRAALAIAILVGSACGTGQSAKPPPIPVATYLATAGRSGYLAHERPPLTGSPAQPTALWSTRAGTISAQPVVSEGVVYWGSWDGHEHATTTSGAPLWSADLGTATDDRCDPKSAGVAGTPTLARIDGAPVLFVASGRAELFALNARTGSVMWRTALGTAPAEFIWGSPGFYGSYVYVGVSAFGECTPRPGRLIQLDAATGSVRHVFEVVSRGCSGGGIWGSPAVDTVAGVVFVATGDSDSEDCSQPTPYAQAVVALNASNLQLIGFWQVPEQDRVPDGDFGATPTIFTARIGGHDRALLGVANKNGVYYAFDRSRLGDGPVWRAVIAKGGSCPYCGEGSISSSSFDGTRLYVAGGASLIGGASCSGGLRALDPSSGVAIWQRCLAGGPVLAGVMSVPGLVLVGTGHELVGAAANSGDVVYRFADSNGKSAFLASVWVADGVVYAGTSGGNLYALR